MDRGRRLRHSIAPRVLALAVAACFAPPADANPSGPSVAAGQASFTASGNTLTVTNAPGTIINWQQFSIGRDEVTRFLQQGPASAVLNRVTGGDPSVILGQLHSNGRVFLVNPAGIAFSRDAVIDTAGLVASSLGLADADFLSGRMRLTSASGTEGRVTNEGRITARAGGGIYLIAPDVENSGVITAPSGDVVLAAGRTVELGAADSPHIRVELSSPGDRAVNVGELVAEAGRVGMYGALVHNAGLVSATSAVAGADGSITLRASVGVTLDPTSRLEASGTHGGTVTVQAERGTVTADGHIAARGSGGMGGTVELLGERVALVGHASLDVSGATGGGNVLVGGDWQGANPAVQNAAQTFAGRETVIRADANATGKGGKVVLWAEEGTRFLGSIAARGGPSGGDGGRVETSGRVILDAEGSVDASARRGAAGEWLLDPNDVTIQLAGVNANVSGGPAFTTTNDNAIVTTGSILAALNAGTSVTVTTGAGGASSQPGDITVANAIGKTGGGSATLTLNAARDINFGAGANVTSTRGALGLALNAAGNVNDLRNVSLNGGTLTVNAAGTARQAAGSAIQGGTSVAKQGTGTLVLSGPNTYSGTTSVLAGTVSVTSAGGLGSTAAGTTVNAGATLHLSGVAVGAEAVTLAGANASLTGSGTAALGGNIAVNAASNLGAPTAADVLTLSGAVSGAAANALAKTGAGTVVLAGSNSYAGATNVNAGTLRVAGGNGIGNSSTVTVAAGATLDLNGANETIGALAGSGTVTLGTGTLTTGGNNATTTFAGAIGGTGGVAKAGTGTFTLAGANTYGGATAVTAGTLVAANPSALGAASAGTAIGGNATLTVANVAIGAEAVTLSGSNATLAGAGNAALGGAVTLSTSGRLAAATAADTLTLSGSISGGAASAITKTGTGTVVLAGNNTYRGATAVSAGTLRAVGGSAIGDSSAVTVAAGATLDLAGANETVGSLAGAGAVALGSGTLAAGGNNTTTTFSGALGGTGGLVKAGTGTLTLSGASTYSGATTVNAGRITATNAAALGSALGGTTVGPSGTLALSGTITLAEPITLAGGTLATITGAPTVSGPIALAAASTLSPAAGTTLTASGAITGAPANALAKTGTGLLVLSGNNTYAGPTSVTAGRVRVAGGNAIGDVSAVSLATGSVLDLNGSSEAIGSLSGAGNVVLGAGTLTAGGDNGTTAHSGVISGTGGLTKTGAGVLTLSGANTYSGATNVSAGTLIAANAVALGTTAGGTTVSSGGSLRIAGVAVGNESVTLNGSGAGGAGALAGTGGTAALGGLVTLGSPATIAAPSAGDSLTLSATVNGAHALTLAGAGTVRFGGAVGLGTPLASISQNAGGTLSTTNGQVRTSGAQTYSGTVVLGANTTLASTGGGPITIRSLAGAGRNLTVNTAGTTDITNATGVATLTTDAPGTVRLNNVGATTFAINEASATLCGALGSGAGSATFAGAVTLCGDTTVTATAASFGATVDSRAGDRWSLAVDASGATVFSGAVGGIAPLADLTTRAGGTTAINGGSIRTTGIQTYDDRVTTGGPTTLVSTTGGVHLNDAVIATSGTLTFSAPGIVSATHPGNDFSTVAVTGGAAAQIVDRNALTLAASDVASLTARTLSGDLTLAGPVNATAAGDAIVLAAADRFVNPAGPLALAPGLGRWLVYAAAPTPTYGGLASGNQAIWNAAYPAVVAPPGNRYVFALAPTATFTSTSFGKTYGAGVDPVPLQSSYAASGFVDASLYGNAFAQDTATNAFTGAPLLTSAGAPGTANVGTYAIGIGRGTLAAATGYGLAFAGAGTLTVVPAPITLRAVDQSRFYGDANPALGTAIVASGTLHNGDAIGAASVSSVAPLAAPAGSAWTLVNGGVPFVSGSASNYAITLADATLAITPRPITLTAGSAGRRYGDANPVPAPLYVVGGLGMANGEDAQAVLGFGVASGATAATPVGVYAGGPHAYAITGLGTGPRGNYDVIALGPGTLTVGARPLTVTANAGQGKLYGEADPAPGFAYALTSGNLVNGDLFAGATARAPGENVGAYAIRQGTLTAGSNYDISFVPSPFSIAPRPITVSATPGQSKVYGDPDPALGFAVAGGPGTTGAPIVSGDALVGALGRAPGENAGAYAIDAGTLGPSAPANYAVTFVGSRFAITPATLDVAADAQAKTYGSPDPVLGYVASGFRFADATGNVLSGQLSRDPGETVAGGPYAIGQGTLTANANYALAFAGNVLTIAPRAAFVVANDATKVYGQPDPLLTYTASGLLPGDAFSGALVRAPGEHVASAPYSIRQGTLANPNYAVAFTTGLLAITPAPLRITADSAARLYGAANPRLGATFAGLVNGDTPAAIPGVTVTTGATAASDVGAYATVATSGLHPDYAIAYVPGRLDVTPAALVIRADDQWRAYGLPNPPLTATATGFRLGQGFDQLAGTLSLATPATASSPAGSYPIVPSGVSSTNYTARFVDGVLTVSTPPGVPADDQVVAGLNRAVRNVTRTDVPRLRPTARIDCLVLERGDGSRETLAFCY